MDRPPVPADMTARWARDYQNWFKHLKDEIRAGLNPRLTPGTRLTNSESKTLLLSIDFSKIELPAAQQQQGNRRQ
jgi:hypothetical protein